MSESYHCPKCWAALVGSYEGTCPKCGVDLNAYDIKYAKDYGPSQTMGDFVEGMADLFESEADLDDIVDYTDKQFLFGSWGHRVGMDILFTRDLRGVIIAAYNCGKERGVEHHWRKEKTNG